MPRYLLLAFLFTVTFLSIGCFPTHSSTPTVVIQTPVSLSTSSPASTSPLPSSPHVSPPTSDSIYFGTVEGSNVIFVAEKNQQDQLENLGFDSSPFLGKVYFYSIGLQSDIFNYKNIIDPRLLFSIPDNEDEIRVIPSGEKLYISGIKFDSTSFVYAVILATGEYQEIWTGSPGYLDFVEGDFLVMKLYRCYRCSGGNPRDVLIYNMKARTEKVLNDAGDVFISIETNIVSFRKLAPLKYLHCLGGEGCSDDGFYEDYWTVGEFLSEPLP